MSTVFALDNTIDLFISTVFISLTSITSNGGSWASYLGSAELALQTSKSSAVIDMSRPGSDSLAMLASGGKKDPV